MTAALPQARQLVTTWWIPEEYGGQTTATLRRVGEQARRSGLPVDLLTFGALWDNRDAISRLRARGALDPGVTLRNLWEDLRGWEEDGTLHQRLAALPRVDPAPEIAAVEATCERGPYGLRSYDSVGELHRADTYRSDGSLLCREAPVRVEGRRRRHQQFFRPDGSSSVLLGSAWDIYFMWLDHLVGDGPAVIVNESKSTARFMSRYRNPRATVIHQFHESHLASDAGDDPYKGQLGLAHRRVLPHLDRFDAVVFLTERQRRDVAERFGGDANLHCVPNAGPASAQLSHGLFGSWRRGDRGIVVATLKPLKRLEHAVHAIAAVRAAGRPVTLDVYGRDGGARADIERTIAETGTGATVTLHGYTPEAARHFAAASFSLLTSQTEGQPLVLLESMAAGCVPISYDIRYGPAELVVDGETGFLVPAGDLEALTETIRRFLRLSPRKLRRLRRQCQERLAAFSDAAIFDRWIKVQHAAVAHRARRILLSSLSVDDFEIVAATDSFAVTADLTAVWDASRWTATDSPTPAASLLLVGRRRGRPHRLPMRLTSLGEGIALDGGIQLDRGAQGTRYRVAASLGPSTVQVGETVSDVYVELSCDATARQVRVRAAPADAQLPGVEFFATAAGNLSLRLT